VDPALIEDFTAAPRCAAIPAEASAPVEEW
jgi:hypothetical protein